MYNDDYYFTQPFKNWKVLELVESDKVRCQCQCANKTERVFKRDYVRSKVFSKDCGCSKGDIRKEGFPAYSKIYYRDDKKIWVSQVRQRGKYLYQGGYQDKDIITNVANNIVARINSGKEFDDLVRGLDYLRAYDKYKILSENVSHHQDNTTVISIRKAKSLWTLIIPTDEYYVHKLDQCGLHTVSLSEVYIVYKDSEERELTSVIGRSPNSTLTKYHYTINYVPKEEVEVPLDPLIGTQIYAWKILRQDPDNKARYICECQCYRKTVRSVAKRYLLKDKSKGCTPHRDSLLKPKIPIQKDSGVHSYTRAGEQWWSIYIVGKDKKRLFTKRVRDKNLANKIFNLVNNAYKHGVEDLNDALASSALMIPEHTIVGNVAEITLTHKTSEFTLYLDIDDFRNLQRLGESITINSRLRPCINGRDIRNYLSIKGEPIDNNWYNLRRSNFVNINNGHKFYSVKNTTDVPDVIEHYSSALTTLAEQLVNSQNEFLGIMEAFNIKVGGR